MVDIILNVIFYRLCVRAAIIFAALPLFNSRVIFHIKIKSFNIKHKVHSHEEEKKNWIQNSAKLY